MAQVETVEKNHVYVLLEDYEGNRPGTPARGMIHISEIASQWVRNIHDFIKENTRVVLRVLRVDEEKGHVDLSLRRVTAQQRKAMIKAWKRRVKARNLLKLLAQKTGKSLDELVELVQVPLSQDYDDLLAAFEAVKEDPAALDGYELPGDLHEALVTLIDQNVEIPNVQIRGIFNITVPTFDGVEVIKKALTSALRVRHDNTVTLKIVTLGAPRYQLTIKAKAYSVAEDLYVKIQKKVFSIVQKAGGNVTLERVK